MSSSQSPATPHASAAPQITLTVLGLVTTETATPPPGISAGVAMQPTPPPTPTPHVYEVRENDTLLDIALRFDVEMDALELANPDLDPRVLQIGQTIIIPSDHGIPILGISSAPPPPLPISPPMCYPMVTDALLCLGLVENNQTDPVAYLQVAVQITGQQGNVLGEQTVTVEQSYIPPGKVAPYRALFTGIEPEAVAGVVGAVVTGTIVDDLNDQFVTLQLSNVESRIEENRYLMSVEIANPAEVTAAPPRLVVTLVDGNGIVRGYRVWQGDTPIPPSVRFSVSITLQPTDIDPANLVNLTPIVHLEAQRLIPKQ